MSDREEAEGRRWRSPRLALPFFLLFATSHSRPALLLILASILSEISPGDIFRQGGVAF